MAAHHDGRLMRRRVTDESPATCFGRMGSFPDDQETWHVQNMLIPDRPAAAGVFLQNGPYMWPPSLPSSLSASAMFCP